MHHTNLKTGEREVAASKGLPGLRGTDHIGFTVPNLEEAIRFFVDILGCEQFFELGPFESEDDWMETHLAVHQRAVMRRLTFLRCKHGSNFEVFEYEAPDQNFRQPRNSDIGGHHLAFYVDDLDSAVTYLKEQDVEILGGATIRTQGPNAGKSWVYFLTPWGMQLELVSYPNGRGYEATTTRRLWQTVDPSA